MDGSTPSVRDEEDPPVGRGSTDRTVSVRRADGLISDASATVLMGWWCRGWRISDDTRKGNGGPETS